MPTLWGASSGQQQPAGDGVVTVCAYLALLLAGAVQALLGSFLFSLGPAPLASVFFDLAILATCALGAWGMGSAGGAVLPAGGWLVVALVLSSVSAGGTVIVTNSMAGQWFLFGGALCAVVGALIGSVWTARLGRSRGQRR